MSNDENYNNLFGPSNQNNYYNNNQSNENQNNQNEYVNENYEKLFGQQQAQNNINNNYENFFGSNTQIDNNNNNNNNIDNNNNNIDNNNNNKNYENPNQINIESDINKNINNENNNIENNNNNIIDNNPNENIPENNNNTNKSSSSKDSKKVLNIPIYIASCKLVHLNNLPFVYYLLKGNLVDQEIYRRFSDFEQLREKLVEIYPCIYIPGLPPKRIIGNQDTKISDMKLKLLNHFLKKLTENKELLLSPVTKIFLSKDPNFRFNLERLKRGNPKEINDNFKQTFTDFNKNEFKYEESSKYIDYFVKVILSTKPRLDVK